MATYNQMQVQQKPKFSVAITTKGYQSLISNTLRDPARARRFTASITSAVAVNPALQECDAGTILAGALLGESLNLSPSPQLGQYYLVPFKQKAKYDRSGRMIRPESVTATFVLGYKGYIQLALRSGQYRELDVMQTARTINRLATIWSRPPVQSMAAPCMKRRRAGAMWRKGGIRNEVDSDYRCHKVDCCVRCNLHFCLCDKGWKIPLVSSHSCIPDLSGVMAI